MKAQSKTERKNSALVMNVDKKKRNERGRKNGRKRRDGEIRLVQY